MANTGLTGQANVPRKHQNKDSSQLPKLARTVIYIDIYVYVYMAQPILLKNSEHRPSKFLGGSWESMPPGLSAKHAAALDLLALAISTAFVFTTRWLSTTFLSSKGRSLE